MTLSEIQDLCEEIDNGNEEDQIFAIEPPVETSTADTDCDSDCSDDAVTCAPDQLPRTVLITKVIAESGKHGVDIEHQPTVSSNVSQKRRRKETYNWNKNAAKAEYTVPDYQTQGSSIETDNMDSIMEYINIY